MLQFICFLVLTICIKSFKEFPNGFHDLKYLITIFEEIRLRNQHYLSFLGTRI